LENCVADQIRAFLAQQAPVFNKKRDQVRPVRPGDIAVLCRNNRDCEGVAEALHRAGLKAGIARAGLLDTPEAKLVLACLKYLLTASDSLSVAEILLLTDSMTLEEIVNDRLEWLNPAEAEAGPQAGAIERWAADNPYIRQLNALRPQTADLSASEILNLLLDELDLRRSAVRLGNPAQRLDNIDRLRFYALDYESACTRLHSAATLGGFLLWLVNLEHAGADRQGSGESDDAVKVLTYHRSKGLEYPVVVCYNLDQTLKEQVWGLNLIPETEKPDLNNILGNRWLRFWVNPYGDQYKKTRLEETLLQSTEWAAAHRAALEEEARLLYVGLTRARDLLVFPTTQHPTKWLNRVFNGGDESIPTLDPHSDETPFYWQGELLHIQTELLYKPKDFPESLPDTAEIPFHSPRAGRPAPRPALLIDPYQEIPPGFNFNAGDPIVFAPWLEFKGDYTAALNNAVKTFFIADDPALPRAERLETAKKQLIIRKATEALTPVQLLEQSDLFRKHLVQSLGLQTPIGKFPVEAWFGKRFLRIEPDLLEVQAGRVLTFTFAPFAEGMKKWKNHAQAFGPWLGWLRLGLQKAYPDKICVCRVVFPIEGQMVEIR
jgi:ATP-dependent helicase/nuclease subunit A